MAFNGSGVFDPPATPEYPAVAGDVIYAAYFNTVMQEIFDGLSNCITKDGQSVVAADINWGNFKLLNVSRVVVGTLTDNGNALQVTGDSTLTGNLSFLGTAKRILSDFSNTTAANRTLFQTSVSNSSSGVGVLANGTGDGGFWNAYSGSDANNASVLQVLATSTQTALNSTVTGAGTQRPLNLNVAGVTKLQATASEITSLVSLAISANSPRLFLIDTLNPVAGMGNYISFRDNTAAEVAWMGFGAGNGEMGFNNSSRNIRFASPVVFDTTVSGITKSSVGLGNVDNTSDATKNAASVTLTNKTISGASNTFSNIPQAAVTSLTTDLGLKAPLASPTLTGTPTVPTAAPGTNTTQAASTAFVQAAVSGGTISTGTFTPAIQGTGSAGSGTYTAQNGQYWSIGNFVFFTLLVGWSAHTGTADMRVTGLPFAPATNQTAALSLEYADLVVGTGKLLTADIAAGATTIDFTRVDQTTGSTDGLPMDTSVTRLRISGCYIKA